MITLVIGGSGSGKSEYAESLVLDVSAPDERYYIATMDNSGSEAKKRIRRHLALREGKGFVTVECSRNILTAVDSISSFGGGHKTEKASVLIEDLPNLLANEMFPPPENNIINSDEESDNDDSLQTAVPDNNRPVHQLIYIKVAEDVLNLCRKTGNAVIVSDNVFEDGMEYDEFTRQYAEYLGNINNRIAEAADNVIEVVAGIPVKIK